MIGCTWQVFPDLIQSYELNSGTRLDGARGVGETEIRVRILAAKSGLLSEASSAERRVRNGKLVAECALYYERPRIIKLDPMLRRFYVFVQMRRLKSYRHRACGGFYGAHSVLHPLGDNCTVSRAAVQHLGLGKGYRVWVEDRTPLFFPFLCVCGGCWAHRVVSE